MATAGLNINVAVAAAQAHASFQRLQRELNTLGKASQTASQRFRLSSEKLAATGRRMTRSITLPIAAAAGAAIKMSADFEASMSKVEGLVGLSADEVDHLKQSVLELAKETPQAPKELAEALFFVTSAGFKGAEAMSVLEASTRAAAGGLGETKIVADAVTSAVNSYGIANLEAVEATDVLTATVREGKAEAADLAPVIGRLAPLAANLGVEFHEVGAALAAFTRQNGNANESATALRGVLSTLIKPSGVTRAALEDLGLTADELRKSVDDKGLLKTMLDLRERIGDNDEVIGKLFPNVRALNGFLLLTGESAAKNVEIFDSLADSTGATDDAFDAASKTAGFKFKSALSSLQVAAIRFGDIMAPKIAAVASALAGLADKFGNLSPTMQRVIIIAGAAVAALGPLFLVLGNIGKAALGAIGAVKALGTALAFLMANPVAAALVGLAAIGVAVVGVATAIKTQANPAVVAGAQAMERFTVAMDQAKAASDRLTTASTDIKDAHLAEKESANAVRLAQENLDAMRSSGTATAAQMEAAELAVKRARLQHGRALVRSTEAEKEHAAAQEESSRKKRVLLEDLRAEARRLSDVTAGVQAYVDGNPALVGSVERFINKMKKAGLTTKEFKEFLDALPREVQTKVRFSLAFDAAGIETGFARGVTVNVNAQARAHGGPVVAGSPYLVGERGPELFVPQKSGRIVPNRTANVTNNVTVNVSQPNASARDIADQVSRELARKADQLRRF